MGICHNNSNDLPMRGQRCDWKNNKDARFPTYQVISKPVCLKV
jgi:hypothetical protein